MTNAPIPPRRSNRTRNLAIGCGVLLLLCVGLGILSSVLGGNRPATVASNPTNVPVGGQAAAPAQPKATEAKTAAPAATAKVAPTPTPAPGIGDTVTSGNWEYTVTQVKREQGALVWSQFGNKTDPAGEWVIIDMTLKNLGDRNFGINTHDFELVDDKGVKYAHATAGGAIRGFQEYQKLKPLGDQVPPGLSINTALVFDINPAATGLKLNLKQARNTMIDLSE